mgnify:FL=1
MTFVLQKFIITSTRTATRLVHPKLYLVDVLLSTSTRRKVDIMLKQAQSNKDIREAAASAGVFLWQVAEAIGVTDGTFSRKLRRELPDDDKAAILQIIQQLSSSAKS